MGIIQITYEKIIKKYYFAVANRCAPNTYIFNSNKQKNLMRRILPGLISLVLAIAANAQTGITNPQMTQSDVLVKNFLSTYDIPGASMALAKDGKIVYLRAFGYADVNRTVPTQPNNLFRIASLSKQITSVTIMHLYEQGRLAMASKVFGPSGILKDHPVFKNANITDNRIYDITVQNLLEHAGGWNRDNNCNPDPTTPYPYFLSGCDPISYPLRVTMLTGMANPVTKDALIKYEIEKGLDFAPGTNYNYSNIGFLILGEVIETITGKPYEKYVQDSILAPLGIYDMHIAKNRITEKYEREGEYIGNNYTTLDIWGNNTYVPWEYGGFNVTAMDAHGGWITTAKDLLKLLVAVDGFATKPDILQPSTITLMTTPSANNQYYAKGWQVNSYNNWWHTGSLDGTASEQVRASNGYTWVIILNKRNITTNQFWTDLDNLGWNCIAATSSWPASDLMADPTINASAINFQTVSTTSIKLGFTNGNGGKRLVIAGPDSALTSFPLDGVDYTGNAAFGKGSKFGNNYAVYNGAGNSVTVTGLTAGKKYFFRVVEYNNNTATGNNSLYLLGANPQASQSTLGSLPITLGNFMALKLTNNTVNLTWQTTQEVNAGYFEIQRSIDGSKFINVTTVAAKGSAGTGANYIANDDNPAPGKNYYRIKMVDKDGAFEYSAARVVDMSTNTVAVSPNPAKGSVNVYSINGKALQLIDGAGKVVLTGSLKSGNNTINTARLASGVYMVKITNSDNSEEVHKLVIEE